MSPTNHDHAARRVDEKRRRDAFNNSNADRHLAAEVASARKRGFEQGSAATLLAIYKSLADDFGLPGALWISSRLAAKPDKPAPFDAELEKLIRFDVIRHMRTYDPARADQVERDFKAYLAGVKL
jgi:hypothetical protein